MMQRYSAPSIVILVLALLAFAGPSQEAEAKPLELKWDSTGYFRSRAIALTNLAPRDTYQAAHLGNVLYDVPRIKRTSYITSRLRITPTLSWGDMATLNFQLDALDDVLWGDNNGLAAAPLFSTDPTDQHFLDGTRDSLVLHKAWVQFKVPVGVMRVGRMPSHWGMGLLANGGGNANMDLDPERPKHIEQRKHVDNYFDDDFGDNHFGTVADRILFLTKPISVFKAIAKHADPSSNLVVGYAYDKISEAPFLRADPAGTLVRPSGQQGYLSRPGDDINQHVAFAVWNDPYAKFGGPLARDTDELRLGTYFVWRKSDRGSTQPSGLDSVAEDTGSDIFITDFWGRLRYGPLYAETEVLAIFGETFGGVPFPDKNVKRKAGIQGGVARFGYFAENPAGEPTYEAILEVGHASGDDDPTDDKFKQRSLHPDHNVGLILFEETLRELSARTYGPPFVSSENPDGAIGFFSNGGVINSNYIHPKIRYHLPGKKVTVVSSVLMAWVDTLATAGPSLFFEDEGDENTGSYLGTEVDLAIKAQFSGNMHFSLETGYLFFGDALKKAYLTPNQIPRQTISDANADGSFTVQSRIAFLW